MCNDATIMFCSDIDYKLFPLFEKKFKMAADHILYPLIRKVLSLKRKKRYLITTLRTENVCKRLLNICCCQTY